MPSTGSETGLLIVLGLLSAVGARSTSHSQILQHRYPCVLEWGLMVFSRRFRSGLARMPGFSQNTRGEADGQKYRYRHRHAYGRGR